MSVSNLFREKGKRKPNILIIITDQERAIQHWPESFSRDHLPAMERLKRHGLTFHHHYTNACMCSPSRSTMLTSQFPVKTGVVRTGSPGPPHKLPTDIPNLATIVKQAGYQKVEWHGKWHVGHTPADYGFAGWQPPDAGNYLAVNDTLGGGTPDNDGRFLRDLCHSLEDYANGAESNSDAPPHDNLQMPQETGDEMSIENATMTEQPEQSKSQQPQQSLPPPSSENDAPFCIVASFVNPHDVYVAQHGPAKGYTHEDLHRIKVPLPSNYLEDCDENNKPRSHGQMSASCVPFECTHQEYVNFYAHLHTLVDAQIGKLLDKLDELNLTESTLIFRTADHGEQGLSHSLVEKFFNCYQESLRIPMIVSNPIAFPKPQTTDALSSHLDLVPTLAGLLGIEQTKTLQGTNLVPVLDDPHLTTTIKVESDGNDGENSNDAETNSSPQTITFPGIQKNIHFTYDDIAFPGAPSTIRCLHKGTLKYAVYFLPNGRDADWELYDLREDPLEDNNLAGKPEYKTLQARLEQELYETMVEKETLPTTFTWPPQPTRYSVGFDHPPGGKLTPPKRRQPKPRRKDPIKRFRFEDEGDEVSVTLEIPNVGERCTDDDVDLIVAPDLLALVITNYFEDEPITLSFGKPKEEITSARCILKQNELIVLLTKKDPDMEWESFHA